MFVELLGSSVELLVELLPVLYTLIYSSSVADTQWVWTWRTHIYNLKYM